MQRVGLIGLGLIGQQRLKALDELRSRGHTHEVVGVHDPHVKLTDSQVSFQELMESKPSVIIVSTPHDVAVNYLEEILPTGITVLAEKPVGRSLNEFKHISSHASHSSQLCVGLNYQYFQGVRKLIEDVEDFRFGKLIRLSIEMGHGGSPSDRQSWKLDPVRAGGGVLLDPGIHLFDLAGTIAGGDITVQSCATSSEFWQTGIEEDAVVILKSAKVPVISLQVSVSQWRSRFRIEVIGTEGYGIVEGRGRSYGEQSYVVGKRWGFLSGVSQRESESEILRTSCESSFVDELEDLLLGNRDSPVCNSASRFEIAMDLVEQCRVEAGLPSGNF